MHGEIDTSTMGKSLNAFWYEALHGLDVHNVSNARLTSLELILSVSRLRASFAM
jgi:hypothetical protein